MTAPARTAAYHALRAIADERADLPAALVQSRRHLPDERDRALAAEIVTGTLRWQRNLDHLAEHFAARPIAKIDSDVLHILRLSLYQLLHLDRVPASAVVDDAVDLARQAESERHGFRQRRPAIASAQATASSPAATSGGRCTSRRRAGLPGHHALPSRMARGALVRQVRIRGHRAVGSVQQRHAADDPSRQHPPFQP